MGTESDKTVTVDDRGRITIPKEVRSRLQLGEGASLDVALADGEIHLRPNRPRFEPVESDKADWGEEAFLDAGEAMVGDVDATDE